MGPARRLVTIKRSGVDGPHFPLSLSTCLFGRSIECDIRIQLPVVSKQHCKIEISEQEAILYNFSSTNPTQVNGLAINKPVQLKHGDVITIIDRSFRYENDSCQDGNKSTEFPAKIQKQEPSHHVSRSSLSSDADKSEGGPLKRRRVSFGGHLRPELFDENLPPNTPLKRGETPTKRKSLVTHTPTTVLKKIIKEHPQLSSKEESASEIHLEMTAQNVYVSSPAPGPGTGPGPGPGPRTTPVTNGQSCRSCKASFVSSGSKSQTDILKRGGRKSGNLPSKRTSISRSQHDILQIICSKRRSGASEANLIVAKSWADVVKLGAKQTQTKVVKHAPQRPVNKRQRRPNTPKKPVDNVHRQFSTGHANSPCTVIIGKAHVEKVNMPAQPYRMLNNFVSKHKLDFKEDLSGLSEMFKTPVKEKPQPMSSCPVALSSSENLLGKKLQVTKSGEEPVLPTSESFGENVLFSTQDALKELSDKYSASPTLRQQCMKENDTLLKTPNTSRVTPVKMKTSDMEPEASKTVSSASRLRTSMELRNTMKMPIECKSEDTERDIDNIMRRGLRRPLLREKKVGEMEEIERSEKCMEIIKSKENSEMMAAGRGTRRSWGQTCKPASYSAGLKRWPEGAPAKDVADSQVLLQTPHHTKEPMNEKAQTSKVHCKSLQPEPTNNPISTKGQPKTSLGKVDLKEKVPSLSRLPQTPEENLHTHKDKGTKVLQETSQQKVHPEDCVTGRIGRPRAPREEVQTLEDLAGFRELFQTPKPNDKPIADDRAAKIPSNSPQPGSVSTPTSTKRQSKTPLGKMGAEEKFSRTPTESTPTPKVPDEDKGIKTFKESVKQKLQPVASVAGSRRRSRAAKEEVQSLEELIGFKELFQTPGHTERSMIIDQSTEILHTSPRSEPVDTPTSKRRQPETCLGKMDVGGEPPTLKKLSQTPEGFMHTPKIPADDKGIKAFKESAKQKLETVAGVAGSRRRSRATKEEVQSLEELTGFQELFQTPRHTKRSMTIDQSTETLRTTPQPELVEAPTITKRQPNTSLKPVAAEEELLALRKLTPSSGKAMGTPRPLAGDEKGIKAFMDTAKQKSDVTENLSGHKRRPRVPEEKGQCPEDMSGFKELFQTPKCNNRPITDSKTMKIPCTPPQVEPVNSPTSTKRRPKTPLGKIDVGEEPPTATKLLQTPVESMHSPEVPAEDKGMKGFKDSAKQKLEPAGSRRSRVTKKVAQPLEELIGFKEIFQTPKPNDRLIADDSTVKIPGMSSQPGLANTPANMKRQPKTSFGKMDAGEELPTLRKLSQTPGEFMHTSKMPAEDKGIKAFKESTKQKLESVAGVAGSRRRSRATKEEVQSLEELTGFQELFQTPRHAERSMTIDQSSVILCTSPQPEPVDTPTIIKRRSNTSLKFLPQVEEELLALRKLTPSSGKAMDMPRPLAGDEKGIKAFMATAKQKSDITENLSGHKRRPRVPEEEGQYREDMSGFKELFQTPKCNNRPITDSKTMKIPCTPPQVEPVNSPTSTKRQPKTPLGKMDVGEEPPTATKLLQTPVESMHTPKVPAEDKGMKRFKDCVKQKLESAGSRRPRAVKEETQPLEDLAGFQEVVQTPGHAKESVIVDQSIKVLWKSSQSQLMNTPTSMKGQPTTSLGKVDLKEKVPALSRLPQTPEENLHTHKGTKVLQETPQQKVHPEDCVTGRVGRPRAPREEVQTLEDLAGFRELFQTPKPNDKPIADDRAAKIPSNSPQPGSVSTPTSTKRQSKTPLGKMGAEEKFSRTPTESTPTPKVPDEDKGIKTFKESVKQKLQPVASVAGSRRRSRAAKEEVQSLEELIGFKELFQTPGHTERSMIIDQSIEILHTSPRSEPVDTPTSKRRQPETCLGKMDVGGEPPTLKKLSQTPEGFMHTPKIPADDKGIKAFKESAKQKLEPVASVAGSRRRSRATKEEVQSLEELTGFQELFQTPRHTKRSMTIDQSTETLCTTPQPELVEAPTITKRQPNTSLKPVAAEVELLALRKLTPSSGKAMGTPRPLAGDEKGIKAFMDTAKQKSDVTENLSGHKRRPRVPEEEGQCPEDMSGFKELFQTPKCNNRPITDSKTMKIPCTPPQVEPVNSPTSTKRRPKTPLGKIDVGEEPPTAMKLSQTPVESMHSPEVPAEDKGMKGFKDSAKQKLEPAGSRRSRAAKEEAQPLEDLAGFQELFQTPGHAEEAVSIDQSIKIPCTCLQPEPVNIPENTESRPQRSLRKVSALRTLMQTSRESTYTHTAPIGEGKGIRGFKDSTKQKLDPVASVHGSSRPRAAKESAQSLQDQPRFKEPFQTQGPTEEAMTDIKTSRFPQPKPVDIPEKIERRPQRSLRKGSALRTFTQTSGESTHTHTVPAGEGKGIKAFKETTEQKLEMVASVPGSRRRARAAKGSSQSLEDQPSFKEPFQTQGQTEEAVTSVKTRRFPQPEPVVIPENTESRPQRSLRKGSALSTFMQTSGESPPPHTAPAGEGKGIKAFKETTEQKLEMVASVPGSRRRTRAVKQSAQSLKDQPSFKEPFQTQGHTEKAATSVKTRRFPQPEPVVIPENTESRPQRRLRKGSALSTFMQISGESPPTHTAPAGEGKGIKAFKETTEQKLEMVASVPGSRRRTRAAKESAQSLKDQPHFKEPFQTQGHTEEAATSVKTRRFPQPEPVVIPENKESRPQRSLRKVSALRKFTQTSGESTHASKEPRSGDKCIQVDKQSAKNQLDPSENITGSKKQPGAPKEETEPLDNPADFKELFPIPSQPEELRKDAESLQSTQKQTPDSGKHPKMLRRVLRSLKVKSMEDVVGTRDPGKSQSKSNSSMSSRKKCKKDENVTGTKRLRCMTAAEGTTEGLPVSKKQRSAPWEGGPSPAPLVVKTSLRASTKSTEPIEDLTSNGVKTKGRAHRGGGAVSPSEGMSLRPRRQNKSDAEQQRTEAPGPAEKVKRSEKKSLKISQELETQNPDDRVKEPTLQGKVSESRVCLRSVKQNKSPQSDPAEEKGPEAGVETHTKNQREKGVRGNSNAVCLRARKAELQPKVNTLESESKQRVTRGIKRRAENPKEDKEIMSIKKIRTRSQKSSGQ
ncbi:proliferation marker protein Ki-67 isoform X2 [Nycticebus coucang]|uniref:proliferation marker protein Ki-67 isoform X2 n=1 Tax=Nycticebus coucang TaxID=9470 RepID=UPI00234DB7D3|nr:proliferation marker protein Ki-67 isoform X2 [Nycticebus coucang]